MKNPGDVPGVTLSGGQKARIPQARAVNHEADIYLFGDSLSAVGVKVGRERSENCLRGILKRKLILMVTHQINYTSPSVSVALRRIGATHLMLTAAMRPYSSLNH